MADEHPVAAHSAALTRLEERMGRHEEEMDAFQDRLQRSVDDWHAHRVEFARLQDSVAAIGSTLVRIESAVAVLDARVTDGFKGVNGRIGKLETASALHSMSWKLAAAALVPLYGIALKQLFGG